MIDYMELWNNSTITLLLSTYVEMNHDSDNPEQMTASQIPEDFKMFFFYKSYQLQLVWTFISYINWVLENFGCKFCPLERSQCVIRWEETKEMQISERKSFSPVN